MKRAGIAILLFVLLPAGVILSGVSVAEAAETGSLVVGYAVVTPLSGSATDLQLSQTFGFVQGSTLLQAGTAAPPLTTSALLFVNTSDRLARNVGLAIANPDSREAVVTMTLRRDDGLMVGVPTTIFVPARFQLTQFITEFFSKQSTVPAELTGTLSISSSIPVAILAVRSGIRALPLNR